MSAAIPLRLILWSWLAAAVYAGHVRLLQRVHPLTLPAIVLLLATGALMICFRLRALRTWIEALDLRRLVLFQAGRFVGIVFLVFHHRGELPYGFAVPAGIGDIAIATLALPIALAPVADTTRRRLISIWNIAGLCDLLLVLATAARLNLVDPASMSALFTLPLSLLPTFLMPLFLAIHAIVLLRLSRGTAAP